MKTDFAYSYLEWGPVSLTRRQTSFIQFHIYVTYVFLNIIYPYIINLTT